MGPTVREVFAVAIVLVLLVVGCSRDTNNVQRAPIGPEGGVVGSPVGPAQVSVPPGSAARRGTITIASGGAAPSGVDVLGGVARALGPAVRLEPDQPLNAADVRMPLEAIGDLPEAGGRRATPANVFIAVFNEPLQTWVPLPTRYDVTSGQVVAAAPHFSLFAKYVVDPASSVWSAATDGIGAVLRSSIRAVFNPDKKEIVCPSANRGWIVQVPASAIEACVETLPTGPDLRIENGLRYPAYVSAPRRSEVGKEVPPSSFPCS